MNVGSTNRGGVMGMMLARQSASASLLKNNVENQAAVANVVMEASENLSSQNYSRTGSVNSSEKGRLVDIEV